MNLQYQNTAYVHIIFKHHNITVKFAIKCCSNNYFSIIRSILPPPLSFALFLWHSWLSLTLSLYKPSMHKLVSSMLATPYSMHAATSCWSLTLLNQYPTPEISGQDVVLHSTQPVYAHSQSHMPFGLEEW